MEALFQRLRARATETADELELRQRNAALELARQNDYDQVVTNETGQVEQTAAKIDRIIAEEHAATRPAASASDAGPPDARPPQSPSELARAMTDQTAFDLETEPDAAAADGATSAQPSDGVAVRHVEVAIDAAGGGGARRYTYAVPPSLADLEAGEAVLVEFGRRQALGIILGDAPPPEGIVAKPIVGRVRADGPLLPPLALALAGWIAGPLPRAAGPGPPGDAPAGHARAARARRRAHGRRRQCRGLTPSRARPPRPARTRPAADPRPRRRRGPTGARPPAPRRSPTAGS